MNKVLIKIFKEPQEKEWTEIIKRPTIDSQSIERTVAEIIEKVEQEGDEALKFYALQFDAVVIENLKVSKQEFEEAELLVSTEMKKAIKTAAKNIERFHKVQKEQVNKIETMPGITCWRKSTAIEKVGLYIPGGTAPLISTLLMLGFPATIAGCKEIVVCTPAEKNGKINPSILFAAKYLKIKTIFKTGGAQAIAAMAYGTATIPKMYKIFGPGNQYVTKAKQMVQAQGLAIDMPAGPSELAVYADDTCVPAFVAADLLSQCEHGKDSQVVLIGSNEKLAEKIKNEVLEQVELLPRKDIAIAALENSFFIVIKKTNNAFKLLNEYAPEHLIIASDKASILAEKVFNAGSVFLGNYSPESGGDYATGTNHTLPTNGAARAFSGVSVDSFVKKITYQQLTKKGLTNIAKTVETLAAAEGLQANFFYC